MLKLLASVVCACLVIAEQANASPTTSALPTPLEMRDTRCTVEAAGSDEYKSHAESYVAILDQQLAQTAQWDAFMKSRTWRPNVPMGEQMTPEEANKFGNLQEQTKIGMLTAMLEAKRSRDLRVLILAASLAERINNDGYIPTDKNSEDFLVVSILGASLKGIPLTEGDETSLLRQTGNCTFERALIAAAEKASHRVSITEFESASNTLNALAASYGKPIDRAKLNPNEKLAFDRAAFIANQYRSQYNLYVDLLRIAQLEQVSKLQRDVRRLSQYESPGNPDHINEIWERWKLQNKVTATQDSLSRVLNLINEKIPTEWVADAAERDH